MPKRMYCGHDRRFPNKDFITGCCIATHAHHLPGLQWRCIFPQEHQQRTTFNELHNDHYRLLLYTNANQLHDIRMVILLQDSSFLQELSLLFVGQGHSAGLNGNVFFGRSQFGFVNIAEVSLKTQVTVNVIHLAPTGRQSHSANFV